MKAAFFALTLAVVVAGCSPSKDIEASIKANPPAASVTPNPATATDSTASKPAATTSGSTTPASTGTATGTATGMPSVATSPPPAKEPVKEPTPPPVDKSADNPNRAFQLRSLAKTTLKVNGKTIDAWIMDSEGKRTEGMMFLTDKDVRDNQGMIFVFSAPQTDKTHGFWMKNTILPLDIVYIAADHKVLNVQAGKPMDETNLPPAGAFEDVLELKQGQASKFGIKPGVVIDVPKDLKAEN